MEGFQVENWELVREVRLFTARNYLCEEISEYFLDVLAGTSGSPSLPVTKN